MSDPPVALPIPVAELTDDLPCTRCGYNLRGLKPDGLCPECFTPVSRSVHGNLLRYADPDWLNKLRKGSALMLWNILVAFVVGLGAAVMGAVGVAQDAVLLLAALLGLLGLWAMFLLTTPEPTVAFTEASITLRRLVRGCAVVQFLGGTLQAVGSSGVTGPAVLVAGAVLGLVGVVSYFGLFVFLRRFAERVPNTPLARSTRTVMWGYGVSMGVAATGALIAAVAGGLPTVTLPASGTTSVRITSVTATGIGPGLAAGGVLACVAGVGILVFGVWYLALLFQYHSLFKTATAQARETLAGG